MSFWLRYGTIGIILATIAYLLLANQDWVELLVGAETEKPDMVEVKTETVDTTKEMAKNDTPEETKATTIEQKPKNAAAEGLSNFYASINPDLNERGPVIRNNVVFLPDPEGDITEILEEKDKTTRPRKKNWKGKVESRAFRNGETLYQKLSEYSNNEGIEILWWLNRDFIIKDPFRINKDLIKTAEIISRSVEGHFVDGIKAYFCYSNKTIVLTDEENNYLESNCNKLAAE